MTKSLLLWSKWQSECTAMKDMKFNHSHRGHGTYFCIWVRVWFSVFVIDILVGAMTHHPAVKWQLRHCSVIIALRNFVLSSTLKSSRQKTVQLFLLIFLTNCQSNARLIKKTQPYPGLWGHYWSWMINEKNALVRFWMEVLAMWTLVGHYYVTGISSFTISEIWVKTLYAL